MTRIDDLMHAVRAVHAVSLLGGRRDRDAAAAVEALDVLAERVRGCTGVSEDHRASVLVRLNATAAEIRSGMVPDRATVAMWLDLPQAVEADRRMNGSGVLLTGAVRERVVWSWRVPHRRVRGFPPPVVHATRDLSGSLTEGLSLADAGTLAREWLARASVTYRMPVPVLEWTQTAGWTGGGFYTPHDHTVHLSAMSVPVLVHEFRHHLQYLGAPMVAADMEEDARVWSASLCFRADPQLWAVSRSSAACVPDELVR